ncbi:MAG: NAD(P)-binding protein [Verrucomicrobiota bacterium]
MKRSIRIVGGGLAGLALGNALRRDGVEVQLYEKRRYPFHRVCGEFLCGVSKETLEALGLENYFEDAVRIERMRWFLRDRCVVDEALPKSGLGISRYTLDARLARAFEDAGGMLDQGVAFDSDDSEGVVWASGRAGAQAGKWIGLSAHFEDLPITCLEMYCGSQGYVGLSPVESGRVNVTGLFKVDRELRGASEKLLFAYLLANQSPGLVDQLRAASYVGGSFAAIAGFDFGQQKSVGQFALGDQRLLIPPFAGNGMSMALEAAAHARGCLVDYLARRSSWNEALEAQQRHDTAAFKLRMQVAQSMHPLLLSPLASGILAYLSAKGYLPTHRIFSALR